MLGHHMLKSLSSTPSLIALSSDEAEYHSIARGRSVGTGVQYMLNKLEWGLEPEYYWKRKRGCEKPYLSSRYGPPPNYCLYNDMQTDPFSYTWTNSISSKSSVATLPTEGRFPPGVFLQPDTKRLKFTPD